MKIFLAPVFTLSENNIRDKNTSRRTEEKPGGLFKGRQIECAHIKNTCKIFANIFVNIKTGGYEFFFGYFLKKKQSPSNCTKPIIIVIIVL